MRIEIVHPSARRFSLERELCGFYDLDDAVVVPDDRLRLRRAGPGGPGGRRLPHDAAAGAAHPRRELGPHPPRGRRAAAPGLGRRRQPRADQRQRQQHPPGHRGGRHRRRHRAQSAGHGDPAPQSRHLRTGRDPARHRSGPRGAERARDRTERIRLPVQCGRGRHQLGPRRQRLPDRRRRREASPTRAPSATSSAASSPKTARSPTTS